MFILKKGHQPGVYVPHRALFLVFHLLSRYVYMYIYMKQMMQLLSFELLDVI